MLKISFDFDGTLEFKDVQEYAKELIERGYNVCILTTRYSDPSKYNFDATEQYKYFYDVANELGITEIHFTEYQFKFNHIDKFNIDIHLDDNFRDEVFAINDRCKAKAILYRDYKWKDKMEEEIKKLEGIKNEKNDSN